jgi:hypothetical protein
MCGPFSAWNSMSRADEAAACPACHQPSRRAVSMPFLNRMDQARRKAHARNEKSAHEPRVMTKDQLEKSGRRRAGHSHGHFAHGPSHHAAERLEKGTHVHVAPDRPWLIGH